VSGTPPVPDPPCPECAVVRTGALPNGERVLARGRFVVHPLPEPSPVPGWLVVAPRRHVEQVDGLDAGEQRALGPLLAEVAAAVRAETGCERVYLSVFAEVLPHLHVHVIARPKDLPPEERGPRVFTSERRADEAERAALFRRVAGRLAAASAGGDADHPAASLLPAARAPQRSPPGRWRAVVLSAAVCPGVGQLAQKRLVPGLLLVVATLGLAGALVLRVAQEASARMPADPTVLGPFFAFDLAAEIQRANAAFFTKVTWGLVLVWVVGIVDAWLAQR
jgi:diadenosine tetraphosphate (Ap4A) HIT family hydrolase